MSLGGGPGDQRQGADGAPAPGGAQAGPGGIVYAFQPRLGGPGTRITLKDDVLTYALGRREGTLDLRDVSGVHLLYHPAKLAYASFETRLRAWDGRRLKLSSVSRVGLTQVKDQGADYAAFVRALHGRLAVLETSGAILGHPKVDFRGGYGPLRWWIMTVLGILALGGLVAVLGFVLLDREWALGGLIALLSALAAWPTVEMISRNRPVRYRPSAPPDQLLPG